MGHTAQASTALEVATTWADALSAHVLLDGVLSARTSALVMSVLSTHIRAGRRHLRVEVRARVQDSSVLDQLGAAQARLASLGGILELVWAGSPVTGGPARRAQRVAPR
jgi:hypothetical protein